MKFIQIKPVFLILSLILLISCKHNTDKQENQEPQQKKELQKEQLLKKKPEEIKVPEGMVWVSGVRFTMGAKETDELAKPAEKPAHPVAVDGFFIDKTEVTNAEFREFVDATGYVTVAERPIDWEEMKKQVPAGTPKPHDSLLQPGSLIFRKELEKVANLDNYTQWWEWKIGANWRHPEGPGSSIKGKDNFPVVHISYEDAVAYCDWANRRLPTEAEWEAAAKGKMHGGIYTWEGNADKIVDNANTWQGEFPVENNPEDGFKYVAPVRSFPPNDLGIYDMSGNVWELTKDWFNIDFYKKALAMGELVNPQGAGKPFNPENPYQPEKVMKGGSFLCHKSYCASYRISARMGMTLDSGSDHVGFRTVATPEMLKK
ncbi:formylglycine-generating enzyme family protein [Salegentibacter chungangensis]|uniref:Formylglycine-generating enzyme family protein n=1 Tax=Salegentibacter chungangensis TaxID=1335724 RepID=A0ABW3NNJ3_9FLAO